LTASAGGQRNGPAARSTRCWPLAAAADWSYRLLTDADGRTRYAMPQTLRAYGADRLLREGGEERETATALAHVYSPSMPGGFTSGRHVLWHAGRDQGRCPTSQ
jgi:hypothetical protein